MGCNLGRNLGARGYSLSLYHPPTGSGDQQVVGNAIQQHKELQYARAFSELKEFTDNLPSPRIIFMLLAPGPQVDDVIRSVIPHLSAGDVLIDGSNAHFEVTTHRVGWLQAQFQLTGLAQIGKRQVIAYWKAHRDMPPVTA